MKAAGSNPADSTTILKKWGTKMPAPSNKKITDEEIIFLRKLGFSGVEIAELRHMNPCSVYARYGKLADAGYFQRMLPGEGLRKAAVRRHLAYAEKVQLILYDSGGAIHAKRFLKKTGIPSSHVHRLIREGFLAKIRFSLKHGPGAYKRNFTGEIFQAEYLGKTFYCVNNRTVIIRLMFEALKPPTTSTHRCILTTFLRRYLTSAERIAVLLKLGVRKFSSSQVPKSIRMPSTKAITDYGRV